MKGRGFTLIELLIVIVILGILITVVMSVSTGPVSKVKILKCKANLKDLYIACYDYSTQERSFPWAGDDAEFWEHWALLVKWCDNGRKISPEKFVCPEFLNKRAAKKDEETGEWELAPENVSYAYANQICSPESAGYLAADMDVRIGGRGQGHAGVIVTVRCSGGVRVHKLKEGEDWESVCGRWLTRE
ncbi:MAG: hypothetical protein DRP63_05775 [Planctomycetota bacterium]|nr:MAG: hypothetical protein DRP63_05775 [Planctomycetota bacterium]